MSTHLLASNIAQMAQMAGRTLAPPRLGLVSSFDGRVGKYAVKVRLMPEDIETGWLPIMPALAGAGWGVYVGPAVGDQAVIIHQEGDINSGMCLGFLASDEDPPPEVVSGEIHLIAKDGDAKVILKADGSITSKGAWTHEGTFHASENITSAADVIDHSDGTSGVSMKEHRDAYNTHGHGGVTAGGAMTGITNTPAT